MFEVDVLIWFEVGLLIWIRCLGSKCCDVGERVLRWFLRGKMVMGREVAVGGSYRAFAVCCS